MCRQNHSFAVDYFALGVIGYEFMLGRVLWVIRLVYVEAVFRAIETGDTRLSAGQAGANKEE